MSPSNENKTYDARANDVDYDLIAMCQRAAMIQAAYTLVAMSRGTHDTTPVCETPSCINKAVKVSTYCKDCRAHVHVHKYQTRSKRLIQEA
ncbi:hypothetical protein FBEOM_1194 [Fusarium beomiforme]|uniref:Uncharacterized protein n=1 Tax=Fusarium beomiforme TaxID=44412 RepID=A0A9P5E5N5_9HYPO|nr:hypothetical protein FBEOM_1194 [Fusarium beomiforme]